MHTFLSTSCLRFCQRHENYIHVVYNRVLVCLHLYMCLSVYFSNLSTCRCAKHNHNVDNSVNTRLSTVHDYLKNSDSIITII